MIDFSGAFLDCFYSEGDCAWLVPQCSIVKRVEMNNIDVLVRNFIVCIRFFL